MPRTSIRITRESGREGDICLMGFSPRSGGLVLYIGPTLEDAKLMSKLGVQDKIEGFGLVMAA